MRRRRGLRGVDQPVCGAGAGVSEVLVASGWGERKDEFQHALLSWFWRARRDLPWRGVGDPYATWVSEIMLQQTQVITVIDYFQRWMARFPDVQSLAAADEEEVLEQWSGLGYYRRARFLHRAAKVVVDEHGGAIPSTLEGLRRLPGVGPYTAGAIASIAFGLPAPIVDGNVIRVFARLFAIAGDPRSTANQKIFWELAEALVDRNKPGDFNEALMELGARVCAPRSPACLLCPVREYCAGFASGEPEALPEVARRSAVKPMRALTVVVHRRGTSGRDMLVGPREAGGLLAGMLEFPTVEREGTRWPELDEVASLLGMPIVAEEVGEVTHIFSHRRLQTRMYAAEIDAPVTVAEERWRWVPESELGQAAISALTRKIYERWKTSEPV
ncbi:A/G-specific adenine glycosylase [Bradymonadaceae bacterium TMQ3]|nr:A/G-specific adenine glycosylase [Bradymonadaceae bacterium TMQ3]TXC76549.1 A/G-specific adenine glycosylase [Bradymonadales bacterium TMQ1]